MLLELDTLVSPKVSGEKETSLGIDLLGGRWQHNTLVPIVLGIVVD